MVRHWPHIAVRDVGTSGRWYRSLLGCGSPHAQDDPHRELFDQIADGDGTVLLSFVSRAGHELPWIAEDGRFGNGFELYFLVEDFDSAWERARALAATVEREPQLEPTGYRTRSFAVRDPDGYCVGVADGTQGWFATLRPEWRPPDRA
jgi:catechol 2,3-dioxygenase-like lactoylglutathione lyase family enzyme